jgi:glycosyltransferase involved in cell wall biosynthesis
MIKERLPLVSVIIPCYNVELFVTKAINSILNQTYENMDIWIIDDASTDNTLEKIKVIKDDRIKVVVYKINTQKITAVNEVLQKINGDFVIFQDADDWSEPQRVQEQLNEFIKDQELGICFTNYKLVHNKVYTPDKISLTSKELNEEFLNYSVNRDDHHSPTLCGTMMISREVLKKTKGYHSYFLGRVGEDIHWIYRILKDFKGITVDKHLYNYRMREGSFTQIQSLGVKPKYIYSWDLLSKIIYKDIHDNIDVLAPENITLLKDLELEACETVLKDKTKLLNHTIRIYENSKSFKLGKLILSPWRFFKYLMGK